ncbi:hypothetical protein GQ55_2G400000 [Panicum hallii var. hallii]|uniref:F-box domain-containing protein n=1 Tax=Panicum hallii var. hallii TaxID=1504633 RepID=A0A2T7EXG8_9POAL|nr:hypothetical protein GQ55_2G400000 [Panicum hallii var. hallii]
MEEGASASAAAAAYLPDDLVVDILARLPAKSLCRFKCVSRRWRSLISDPAHRARLAQTLSGFFFVSRAPAWRFAVLQSSVTPPAGDGGPPPVDTSLSFLPPSCGEIKMLDSCNGLLLLRCSNERPRRPPPPFYVVCNPATREWWPCRDRGFDPAVSSHFYVFQMVVVDYTTECYLEAVEIYSSETGAWIMSEMGRGDAYFGAFMHHMTYFNGSLHLTSDSDAVASVGAKGRSWRITHVLRRHSQGHLLYVDDVPREDVLSIYVLEDQDSGEWALTPRVSKKDLLFEPWKKMMRPTYYKAGFHPNVDLIFFYDRTREKLIAYDMSRNDWRVVCTLGDFKHAHRAFFPYVPWYSRGLASPNSS